ncbi:kinase-like domain-containing protein [Xylariaceae sp. AK1471]|nr:kinase-like domain-containing protein [Xylariaceae sp. AK1471]
MAPPRPPPGFGYEEIIDIDIDSLRDILERQQGRQGGVDKRIREIRDHFNSQCLFKYEDLIGRGSFGMAFRVIQRGNKHTRRLIVKRSLDDETADELRNEIRTMERLNGSAHIASVIATHDDPSPPRRPLRTLKQLVAKLKRKQHAMLIGLRGPALVIEYLENGDLNRVRERAWNYGRVLPNRILWSFLFCLVRACVAMAFPPNKPPDTAPQLETIPTNAAAPGDLRHGDMHSANILVGTANDFPEHAIVPPLKLIDFGLATQRASAVRDNIMDIGRNMITLIARQSLTLQLGRTMYKGIDTMATEILPGSGSAYPTLDPDIRDLMALCLANDPADRPDLATLLQITQDAVNNKDAASFSPNDHLETDEEIRRVLQMIVYDAEYVYNYITKP